VDKPKSIVKRASLREKEFAKMMAETGLGSIEAARKVFMVKCEPGSKEAQKYRDLARTPRVKKILLERQAQLKKEAEAEAVVTKTGTDFGQLRKFAYRRLLEIRDDLTAKSTTRLFAIKTLEKLHDPASDVNLVMKWIDTTWRFAQAHCPACHRTYPLHRIKSLALEEYRLKTDNLFTATPTTDLERRIELIKLADRRKLPHPSQVPALEAPERHIVGMGAARAGKSWLMAVLGLMGLMLPGVEIWILARVYEDAKSEVEYIKGFLKSLFYPFESDVVDMYEDKKNGELHLYTKWGSILKIRSAKAKGSITGRELEMALVAEPGWVSGDIYEELRSRMSSRLGRIFAFGTPQGSEGFIPRLVKTTGRDPITHKIVRLTPQQRLIANGADWNISLLVYTFEPKDNPEYVQSELAAARMELTDVEYAAAFEGKMVDLEGAKFPGVTEDHLVEVPISFFQDAMFVLGIDQGPKNFGAVLTAYDGNTIVPCYEFFDSSERTMKANLKYLILHVPMWIRALGGMMGNWSLTITDKHPQIWQIVNEMQEEGQEWPTETVERHQNFRKMNENWRRETQEWVNNLARRESPGILFHLSQLKPFSDTYESPGTILLHDQVRATLDKPDKPEKESGGTENLDKGWIIRDPWRGDHVVDAWYFTLWTIISGQLIVPEMKVTPYAAYKEAQKAFEYTLAVDEARELKGWNYPNSPKQDSESIFQRKFGRPRSGKMRGPAVLPGYYPNES